MRWHELTIHTTEEAVESVSYFLQLHGAGGVSIEESGSLCRDRDTSLGQWYEHPLNDIPEGEAVMKAYFPFADGTSIERRVRAVERHLQSLPQFGLDPGKANIDVREVADEDWENAWKQYFKPVRVTERLTIKPTWEPYGASPEETVIELDPGMAFGTGTHATTTLCLQLLERHVENGTKMIDVGCGSGILSVAGAKLGAKRVYALDLDPVAVSSATENAALNGLQQRMEVMQSDLLQALQSHPEAAPADLVVANILAEILLQFMDEVVGILRPGGVYIASGIIRDKAMLVEKALADRQMDVVERLEQDDWVALAARKVGG